MAALSTRLANSQNGADHVTQHCNQLKITITIFGKSQNTRSSYTCCGTTSVNKVLYVQSQSEQTQY